MASLAEDVGWLFGWLLRNSAHAAVLALVVWGLERTVCRRLPPRWRYGLWLLVVVRLLIPIAPGSPLSLFNLFDFAPASLSGVARQLLGLPSPVPVPLPETPHPLADTPPWFLGALALWLPGALILGVLVWRDQQRLRDALGGAPVLEPGLLDLLEQSKGVMGVRRSVELVETARMSAPAITGWWRPRILLPEGLLPRLTPDETRFLLLHELAHVKRWDIALNWVLAVVQVLHWFNPVVWFALRRLLTVREEVCDNLVLRRSFQGAAREYGLTLIRLLEECAPRRLLPAYAGVLDDVQALRQRVRCIRDFSAAEPHPWSAAFITVVVAVVGLTERTEHHALASATGGNAYAEAQDQGRTRPQPVRGARSRPVRRSQPTPAQPPAETEVRRAVSTLPSVLDMIQVAFDRAVRETRGSPPAPASTVASDGPTAPGVAMTTVSTASGPSSAAVAGSGTVSLASRSVRSVNSPPPGARLTPVPLAGGGTTPRPLAAQAGMARTGRSVAAAARATPLPLIQERAGLVRSVRADGAPADSRSWAQRGGDVQPAVLPANRRPTS